jgi:hypothetical protein
MVAMKRRTIPKLSVGVLLAIATLGTLGSWAISSPVGSSPDDDYHLVSIYCASTSQSDLCAAGSSKDSRKISTSVLAVACYAQDANISAACQEEIGVFNNLVMVDSKRGNFIAKYPPIFYEVNGLLATNDVPTSTLTMRLLNLLIFLGMGIALWFAVPRSLKTSMILMWTLTLVPLGLFIIASTNPSSWVLTGVGSAFIALLGFRAATGRRQWVLAGLFGVSAILAAGARADGAVYVGVALVAAFAMTWQRWSWRIFIVPAGILLVAIGIFLTTRNTALTGAVRVPLSAGEIENGITLRNPLIVLGSNILKLPDLWGGAFGRFALGWLDTGMPPLVWGLAGTACAVIIFVRLHALPVINRLLLLGIGVLLTAIPLYYLQIRLAGVGESFQPRYVLPLLVIFVGVTIVQRTPVGAWLSLTQAVVLGVMLAVAQSVALYENLSRYVRGDNTGGGWNLDEDPAWWWEIPFTPMTVWLIGTLAFAAALTLVLRKVLEAGAEPQTLATSVPEPTPQPAPVRSE